MEGYHRKSRRILTSSIVDVYAAIEYIAKTPEGPYPSPKPTSSQRLTNT
jgi:hypothetical protein